MRALCYSQNLLFILAAVIVYFAMATAEKAPIPIKAVIFDMDGTLLDTEQLSTDAIESVLVSRGVEEPFTWELKAKCLGLRGLHWTQLLIDHYKIEDRISPNEFVVEWETFMNQRCSTIGKMPGADYTTTKLRELGVPLAIATSSYQAQMEIKRTKHVEMFARMNCVICGNHPEVCVCSSTIFALL